MGITLVEIMIAVFILSIVFLSATLLFSAGWQGTRHGHEVMDHSRSSAILFRAIKQDIQRCLPWPIMNRSNQSQGSEIYYMPPHAIGGGTLIFWVIKNSQLMHIRYRFSEHKRSVIREVINSSGRVVRTSRFGEGHTERFGVELLSMDYGFYEVIVSYTGTQREVSDYYMIAAHRKFEEELAKAWIYDF